MSERRPKVLTEEFIGDFNERVGRHLSGRVMLEKLWRWKDLPAHQVPSRWLLYMKGAEVRVKIAVGVAMDQAVTSGFTSVNSLRARTVEEIREGRGVVGKVAEFLRDGFEIPDEPN
jgi:hypothetical protein